MQLSERFRRGVVVPLDDDAAVELEGLEVTESTLVHFVEIADQAAFEELWNTGIFDAVNEATGSMLDDYEEEEVPAAMVPRVRELAQSYAAQGVGGGNGVRFFEALADACRIAEQDRRPIYFVL